MGAVIEVEGLRKEYRGLQGKVAAIDGLDLSVPEGGVFGFLGPNGSGKTTTIRCLLGLIRPTAGRCTLLGQPTPSKLASVIGRVGAIVETPALFPTFTGRTNLRLLAQIGDIDDLRVSQVLERVGLAERADSEVKTYSLGMRQRLGLAAALLKDPDLLILDEPANGLDPAGIREIRELLRSLAAEGRTVFVSSHILSEVQQTCDAMAILSRGRLVTQGTVHEVIARSSTTHGVLLRVPDPVRGLQALRDDGIEATLEPDDSIIARVDPGQAGDLNRRLGEHGLWVTELRPQEATLEDVFLELTGEPPAGFDATAPAVDVHLGPSGATLASAPGGRGTVVIRLFRVECRRDLTRDLTRWLILMFVVVSTIGIVIAWFNVDNHSSADSRRVEDEQIQECARQAEYGVPTGPPVTFVTDGVVVEGATDAELTPLSGSEAEEYCRDLRAAALAGEPAGELWYYGDDPRPSALDLWDPNQPDEGILLSIQSLLLIAGLGAAASMVGAEWKAGTITTQLTWSPNRIQVFVAKAAAAGVLAAAIAYVLQIWFALLTYGLIAAKGGVTEVADGAWLASLAGAMGRVSILVAMGAIICVSLAMIFRNTAGAILVVFGYMAVAESALRVWQPDWDRWFIGENMSILLSGQALDGREWERGPLAAGLVLACYILALATAAAASFKRRDIAGTG